MSSDFSSRWNLRRRARPPFSLESPGSVSGGLLLRGLLRALRRCIKLGSQRRMFRLCIHSRKRRRIILSSHRFRSSSFKLDRVKRKCLGNLNLETHRQLYCWTNISQLSLWKGDKIIKQRICQKLNHHTLEPSVPPFSQPKSWSRANPGKLAIPHPASRSLTFTILTENLPETNPQARKNTKLWKTLGIPKQVCTKV